MQDVLKVGIAGLGTVGASLVRLIAKRDNRLAEAAGRPIRVTAVTARSRRKDRGIDLSGVRWAADPVSLAADPDIDVFVELVGGAEEGPAREAVEMALSKGKAVVTANKALLAAHGRRWPARPRPRASLSISRRPSPVASPSSRRCARACSATRSSASTASSTAPATTSSPAWRRRASPSRIA